MSVPIPPPQRKTPAPLADEAARCVACGLCLPHCPTYRKTLSEADSPRGRIALMQGVLERRIPANERFQAHIDLCLACRACENVCPNNVEYGRLINGVRGIVEKSRRRSVLQRLGRRMLVDGVATKPAVLRLAGGALRTWQAMAGKAGWMMRLGLARIATRLPQLRPQPVWQAVYPAMGKARGEVGLFLGCVARVTDVETLSASIFVLNRLGYMVHVPPRQGCCGAMHVGLGESEKASAFEGQNLQAFAGMNVEAVISTATGCGAALKNYPQDFAGRVRDISEFLGEADGWGGGWEEAGIAPLAEKMAVHEPCLMRNVLHCQDKPYDLLRRIPGATVVPLAGNDQCCGAAGTYFLTQPDMAASLLADKIEAVKASGARILATSNIGCAMHLAVGLKAAGIEIEVVHPITLLARQMGFENDKNR
ncbi:MAG: heterodisulfide reductase-related iron-sulfur binding cluster [Sulfuricella sp.]|nr:heterodisulfide reductase-related iron-sulfur binding cluster [Sulfuricella sp.]